MPKTLNVRLSSAADALDRFEAAWHLATGRAPAAPLQVLGFAGLPLLLRTLTPARWALLERLRKAGPLSVYALARALGRDYKNVHTDVRQLTDVGLIEKQEDGKIRVAWDSVRAELRF